MKPIKFVAMATEVARAYQAGGLDANGQKPERHVSDGHGVPCRHCQRDVAAGEAYLILAYRPFPEAQPYAEVGPIFLHADACERYPVTGETPEMFLKRERFLIKGYHPNDRIYYGTGQIVASAEMASTAARLLEREDVAYVHVRSALNNCYQCRIDRA
jgi:Protein of unknown function (DUF1203)